jgi:hypothetical protein
VAGRLDPDGSIRVVLERVTVSSGLAIDAGGGLWVAMHGGAAAGALFRAVAGVTGLPAATFAG